MAEITQAEVRHVASLAKLALSEEELTRVGRELNRILDYFAVIPGPESHEYESVLALNCKAAVLHANKCLAIDLARYGIRVNCIAPAHIPTDINARFDQSKIIAAMQPLQRQGTPHDVAEAMLYLASDRAAQITGIVLPVAGGTTAGPPARDMRKMLAVDEPAG